MAALLGIFLAKLLDPIALIGGLISGTVCRVWWHFVLAGLVIAGIVEILLSVSQLTRTFNPVIFLIGWIAAIAWVAIGFLLRRAWRQRRSN